MDRTAWIVVTICAVGLIFMYNRTADQVAAQQKFLAEQRAAEAAANPEETDPGVAAENPEAPEAAEVAEAPKVEPNLPLEQQRLENDEAHYQLTTVGGGIDTVTLLNHRAFPGVRVILNDQ